jgi:transposase
MQGRKNYTEKLFLSFQLSDRIPKENLYRRLLETLDLSFLYEDTKELFGRTGNPSIDPVVFFKLLIRTSPPTGNWWTLQYANGRALLSGF